MYLQSSMIADRSSSFKDLKGGGKSEEKSVISIQLQYAKNIKEACAMWEQQGLFWALSFMHSLPHVKKLFDVCKGSNYQMRMEKTQLFPKIKV